MSMTSGPTLPFKTGKSIGEATPSIDRRAILSAIRELLVAGGKSERSDYRSQRFRCHPAEASTMIRPRVSWDRRAFATSIDPATTASTLNTGPFPTSVSRYEDGSSD